ncbi:MAG TPA: HDOD domain-containing protein, partial [Pyrinomonadaceae bacterium]|nr:HDOD domain-containing protein [Pyrinomonadaceae bacterium]
ERATVEGDISLIEKEVFGFDHAELGVAAADKWNLPGAISDIIRFHHMPLRNTTNIAIGRIVNIADTFVYLKNEDKDLDDLLFSEVVLGFGFSGIQFEALWEDLLIRLEEVSFTFN